MPVRSDVREIVLVLVVALIGVLIAAAVVLAPWHPAEATQAPVTGFIAFESWRAATPDTGGAALDDAAALVRLAST